VPDHEYASARFSSSLGSTPVVIEVAGELDHRSAPMVEDVLIAAGRPGMDLVVDLSGVRFCDCAGLGALLRTACRFESVGGRLRLAAAQPAVARLLALAGTPEVMGVYPRVRDAVEAVRAERLAGSATTETEHAGG